MRSLCTRDEASVDHVDHGDTEETVRIARKRFVRRPTERSEATGLGTRPRADRTAAQVTTGQPQADLTGRARSSAEAETQGPRP